MDPPPIQYVTTTDGYNIAYAVSGRGPPLVLLPWGLIDIRFAWHTATSWLTALGERFRVVQLDVRGRGLSQRGLPPTFTALDYLLDVSAVIDKLALDNVTVLSNGGFGHVAVRYAAANPGHVRALILANCPISQSAWPRSSHALAAENWSLFVRSLIPPGLTLDEHDVWHTNMLAVSTYEDWQASMKENSESDISGDVGLVRAPCLVLVSSRFYKFRADEVAKLAASIEHARLVMIDSRVLEGDATQGLAVIDAFLEDIDTSDGPAVSASLPPGGLSSREIEVLRLISAGKSNPQIAEELVISLNTVQRHVSNILAKTGAANRTEAALYARDRGLA